MGILIMLFQRSGRQGRLICSLLVYLDVRLGKMMFGLKLNAAGMGMGIDEELVEIKLSMLDDRRSHKVQCLDYCTLKGNGSHVIAVVYNILNGLQYMY